MSAAKHTAGLHRGYADNLRVEWERRGKSGHSSITLLNTKKRPVAVLLGDYVPGECDADMAAAANLFCAAPDMLEALRAFVCGCDHLHTPELAKARAAIAKATAP